MEVHKLRQQAAWLDAGAIKFASLEVAPLLRRYADEARARADIIERRNRGEARPDTLG